MRQGNFMCNHFLKAVEMLTEIESKIVTLLFQGLSAKEAARILQCSHRTVEGQISNIKLKLGVPKLSGEVLCRILDLSGQDWKIENLGCSCFFCKK